MDYCWWHERQKGKPTAHIVSYLTTFLGMEIYRAYCGRRTVFNRRKKYGKVEQAVRSGGEICWECWNNLPHSLLMEITHLPMIKTPSQSSTQ